MGAVLQTAGAAELVAELTCCAASSVCGLVTRDSATRAKFRYCSFLLLATVTCVILLIPGLRLKLDKIPNLCNKLVTSETCDTFIGFSAVYRILISITVFHFLLSILTIRVTRIKSFRARFNNGLWLFKMGLIFGLTIGSFYIPKKKGFFRIWMYISMTGGFMFVLFQIILIIDFGHSWSISWAEKLETGHTKLWYIAMAMVTLLMFAISFGAMFAFYLFFTHPPHIMKCQANLFYITFIGIQCFLATVVSITPSVQQELSGAGLLQSSVVILYAMYLTWNTLSSEPDSMCNPLGNIILEYDSLTGVNAEAIFGCLITLILLIFACTVRANTSHLGKYGLALAESEEFAMATYREDEAKESVEKQLESGDKEVSLSEYVGYNYSFFHIIMSLASLHILMVLTNWHSPEENSNMKKLVKNWASVWVQMASSFVCLLVYVWFLVTPLVKRVWGPMFGVILDDEKDYAFYEKPKETESRKPVENFNAISPTDEKIFTPQVHKDFNKFAENESFARPESRNTYNPVKSKPVILRRRGSEESIISAVTAVSNVTATTRKSKRKNKLLTVQETDDDESVIPKKVIIPLNSESLQRKPSNKRIKKKETDRDIMYSSCESITSRVSNYVKKNISKLKRKSSVRENTKSEDDKEITLTTSGGVHKTSSLLSKDRNKQKNTPIHSEDVTANASLTIENTNETDVLRVEESAATLNRKTSKYNELYKKDKHNSKKQTHSKIVEEEILFETKIYDKNKMLKNQDNLELDEPSLVPSIFNRKPQKPETAKEILQLQWKILRTQAKVVKIQEKIIRLQTESELVSENAAIPPPTTQSSFIQQTNKKKKHQSHNKELG